MTEEKTQELAVATIMNYQPGTAICSIKPEAGDKASAKVVYNAMNNPTYKLSDFINKKIKVENVLIEVNDIMDEETGELTRAPRVVLIAPDGTSYSAISKGIFNSVKNAYAALGEAPWSGGIEFEVKQQKVGRGNMLTLQMV